MRFIPFILHLFIASSFSCNTPVIFLLLNFFCFFTLTALMHRFLVPFPYNRCNLKTNNNQKQLVLFAIFNNIIKKQPHFHYNLAPSNSNYITIFVVLVVTNKCAVKVKVCRDFRPMCFSQTTAFKNFLSSSAIGFQCCFNFIKFKIPIYEIINVEKTSSDCPEPGYM